MGTRIVPLSAAFTATLLTATLWAQEPSPPAASNLLAQTKWIKLEVVGGRIVPRVTRCCQSRYEAEAVAAVDSRQSLSVDWSPGAVGLRYEETSAARRLLWTVSQTGNVTISCFGSADRVEVQYHQPPAGQVSLRIGGKSARTVSASDMWQLALVFHEECHEQLFPLLSRLREDWDLVSQVDQVEAALFRQAGTDVIGQRQRWQREVEGLAGPSFAGRQAADQALRSGGPAVLAFLRQLDEHELDGEQRRRVRAIVADLSDGHADSPPLVADWFLADNRVWLALLSRGQLEQRIAAAYHLSKLCRRSLLFDPAAPPQQRTAQLAELTAKLAQP